MSDDPNSNPFGESPTNGTPDPKNPFQFAAGGAKTETPPSPFEISASNPFASKDAPGATPAEGGAGFDMKGFSGEDQPMNQLDAAPVEEPKPNTSIPSVGKASAETKPAAPARAAAPAPAQATPPAAPATPPAAAARPSAPAPASSSSAGENLPTESTKQLVLRAIFGVDHELSHQQIVQRARTLPGVKNISAVDAEAAVALTKVRNLVGSIGFGAPDEVVLSSPQGTFDFISAGRTTLAILREGEYAPGVRETLILIAQEIDKL